MNLGNNFVVRNLAFIFRGEADRQVTQDAVGHTDLLPVKVATSQMRQPHPLARKGAGNAINLKYEDFVTTLE